jgi:phenylalanyl-tRNA synthetase alpha chain
VHQNVEALRNEFSQELKAATSSADLEALRVKYLGRKGPIQDLMKTLKDVPAEKRPHVGKEINDLKELITEQLSNHQNIIHEKELASQLVEEKIDVSLPGRRPNCGRMHPVTEAMDEIIDILIGMGFTVQYGPDIDTDYYNFEALNFPPDHPARDMQDTFYITQNVLLRTHTSNIQARVMEQHKPPIRIITPGKAYRNETITARSHVFFHQVEGFYVDKNVTFADLFATMQELYRKLFQADVQVRYRPSYFPFVEPGLEVDISCLSCDGHGCSLCKYTGWLEVCGAGMIHPEVLQNGGIDPEVYSGYAWGMGVERNLLLKRGVKDIRMLTENDLRFLSQF